MTLPFPRALLHLPELPAATAERSVTETAHTRREELLQLLRSRTQAEPRWTPEELSGVGHQSTL